MTWLIAGVVLYALALIAGWSLCKAAADGDRYAHEAWERKDQE